MANRSNSNPIDYFADANDSPVKGGSEVAEERESDNGSAGTTGTGTSAGTGTESSSSASSASNSTVNPADLADIYQTDAEGNIVYKANGEPAKKRGRKKGQTAGTTSTKIPRQGDKTAIAVEMLAMQFQILNTGLAFLTRFDDFRLEENEAMSMAVATANVMEQFDFTPDPKIAAVLGLVTTTSMIYGPRIYLYKSHLAKQAKEKKASVPIPEKEEGHEMNWMKPGPFNTGQFN